LAKALFARAVNVPDGLWNSLRVSLMTNQHLIPFTIRGLEDVAPADVGNVSLCEVARRYGSVSDTPDPSPDFYFSGDWFHELSDGFALLGTRGLSLEALLE
jgi:hypothetical protein